MGLPEPSQDQRDAIDDLVSLAAAGGATARQRRLLRRVLEEAAGAGCWWGASARAARALGERQWCVSAILDRAFAAIGRRTPHSALFRGAEQLVGKRLCEVALGLEGLKRRRTPRGGRFVLALLDELARELRGG